MWSALLERILFLCVIAARQLHLNAEFTGYVPHRLIKGLSSRVTGSSDFVAAVETYIYKSFIHDMT